MRFGRRSWFWVIVAALGTTIWWSIGSRAPRMEPRHGRTADETSSRAAAPPVVVPPAGAERTAQELPPDDAAHAAASSDPYVRWLRDPDEGLLVEGTVTVLDADDREHGEEDGEFAPLALLEGRGGGARKVAVHAGRFRMHFPPGRELGIASLVLGGRSAFLPADPKRSASSGVGEEATIRFAVAEGTPIHVLARWARPFFLHVVDARDRSSSTASPSSSRAGHGSPRTPSIPACSLPPRSSSRRRRRRSSSPDRATARISSGGTRSGRTPPIARGAG
jgi:hypothetical protein